MFPVLIKTREIRHVSFNKSSASCHNAAMARCIIGSRPRNENNRDVVITPVILRGRYQCLAGKIKPYPLGFQKQALQLRMVHQVRQAVGAQQQHVAAAKRRRKNPGVYMWLRADSLG